MHLETSFSGGLGSFRFVVGLDELQGLFQPKQFYDSLPCSCQQTWSSKAGGDLQGGLSKVSPGLRADWEKA